MDITKFVVPTSKVYNTTILKPTICLDQKMMFDESYTTTDYDYVINSVRSRNVRRSEIYITNTNIRAVTKMKSTKSFFSFYIFHLPFIKAIY